MGFLKDVINAARSGFKAGLNRAKQENKQRRLRFTNKSFPIRVTRFANEVSYTVDVEEEEGASCYIEQLQTLEHCYDLPSKWVGNTLTITFDSVADAEEAYRLWNV